MMMLGEFFFLLISAVTVVGSVTVGGTTAAAAHLTAGANHDADLRSLWLGKPAAESSVTFAVSPPPGVQGSQVVVQMSTPNEDRAWPYAAGLTGDTEVGRRIPVAAYQHWVAPESLPSDYDARHAFPGCSTMRAIQNQGACAGCYSFATTESLGDRICQASNGTVDAILSAEDPLFCPNLGGCRGGNLGPVWDYLANVGVPSGCSPGQNDQPNGTSPNQSGGVDTC
jgi:hypothetical protein